MSHFISNHITSKDGCKRKLFAHQMIVMRAQNLEFLWLFEVGAFAEADIIPFICQMKVLIFVSVVIAFKTFLIYIKQTIRCHTRFMINSWQTSTQSKCVWVSANCEWNLVEWMKTETTWMKRMPYFVLLYIIIIIKSTRSGKWNLHKQYIILNIHFTEC